MHACGEEYSRLKEQWKYPKEGECRARLEHEGGQRGQSAESKVGPRGCCRLFGFSSECRGEPGGWSEQRRFTFL